MATNVILEPGLNLDVAKAGIHSNDIVTIGDAIGVALNSAQTYAGVANRFTLRPSGFGTRGVIQVQVAGVNQSGNSAVTQLQKLYYVAGDVAPGVSGLSKKNTGVFFGYAYMPAVADGATLVASAGSGTIYVVLA